MHRFNAVPDAPPKASKKRDLKQQQDDIEEYLYRNDEGLIYQPSSHIIGCLKYAGAKFQIPGRGKTTYKNLMGSGSILVTPDAIVHEIQDFTIDRRAVVVNNKRIVRGRPLFPKWALSFLIEYEASEITFEVLHELLVYAGQRSGIGDFRPAKGGPFGRFVVTRFERTSQQQAA